MTTLTLLMSSFCSKHAITSGTFIAISIQRCFKLLLQYEVARHLQQFYEDFVAGKRPKLVLSSPPQHGKSMMMVDFIAWIAGKNPRLQTIFASYSDKLGERANSELQYILDGALYQRVFWGTRNTSAGQCHLRDALQAQ